MTDQWENRVREIETLGAIFEERFARIQDNNERLSVQFRNQLDDISAEVNRQRDAQYAWTKRDEFESFKAEQRRAIEIQVVELDRRLNDLNGHAAELRQLMAVTVTSEKFADFVETQQRALEIAVSSTDQKFTALAEGNAEAIRGLSDRLLRLEESVTSRADRLRRETAQAEQYASRQNGWRIALLGMVVSLVVVGINLLMNVSW